MGCPVRLYERSHCVRGTAYCALPAYTLTVDDLPLTELCRRDLRSGSQCVPIAAAIWETRLSPTVVCSARHVLRGAGMMHRRELSSTSTTIRGQNSVALSLANLYASEQNDRAVLNAVIELIFRESRRMLYRFRIYLFEIKDARKPDC